jgi:hypothetical protein
LRTEQMLQNFELELEWRHMVPGGNAGVFIWADDITARGVPFHRGIEVQVLENAYGDTQSHTTHGDIFPIHGAKMKPVNGRGGDRAFPTELRSKPSPEWNHYRIVCNDGSISLAVNGKVVTKGTDASPRKGYICLESEGGVVHYRNIKIKELPATPVEEKDVAIANRGYRSIYTGLDLSGWRVEESAAKAWQAKDWVLAFDGKVSGSQAQLKTAEPVKVAGMVIDFRFVEGSESLSLQIPGVSAPIVIQPQGDTQYTSALQKRGAWNRAEFTLDSGHRHMTLNGTLFRIDANVTSGDIVLAPTGPIEVANIYVR